MAYGCRTDIVGQILESEYDHDGCYDDDGEGISQTKIMNGAYLSRGSLKDSLIALSVHGLLFYDSAMRRYHVTEKGMRFLELYCKLDDLIYDEKKENEEVEF
jgi:predicted transcriptional regulator